MAGFRRNSGRAGVSLIETVVGTAVFLAGAISLLMAIRGVYQAVRLSRVIVLSNSLATEQFEIVRNLPYADVGIVGGLPAGKITREQVLTRGNVPFSVTTTVRNIDDPFDGVIGGTPNDTSPADYKLVEVEISCATCKGFAPASFTTLVAPKSLETASTNGALFIQVIDASGQPVAGADVVVENASSVPPVLVEDVTNNAGMLQLVDVPPGANQYAVSASKEGYSSERTYAPDSAVVNPVKPHATVALQQVTQLSMSIDRVSTLDITSVGPTCASVGNVDFDLLGAKLIGTTPDQRKYEQSLVTDGSGALVLPSLEWDSYQVVLDDFAYDLAGTVPLLPLALSPNATQDFQLIVAPKDPRSVLVTVKDAATQLPLTDASVRLRLGGYDETLMTNRGFLRQTDWSGGGQSDFVDPTKFFAADLTMETAAPAGELRLKNPGGVYVPYAELTSSTFDTGSAATFHQLQWLPLDQPPTAGADSLRFQIATNNDNMTWNFTGPDGTSASYYSASNTNIDASHDGDRYLRYKVILATEDSAVTPNVADVSFTFTSACTPPGQVLFTGLDTGTYSLSVDKDGYQPYDDDVVVSEDWRQVEVLLTPS